MKNLRLVVRTAPLLGISMLLMGLSMPSCPGLGGLQQSIDALKASEADMKAKIGAHDTAVKGLQDELTQLKSQVTELANVVLAQKTALEDLNAKMAAGKTAATKGKPAKKR